MLTATLVRGDDMLLLLSCSATLFSIFVNLTSDFVYLKIFCDSS
jgi:hypothetical protein